MESNFWQYYFYIGVFATMVFVIKLALFSISGGDSEVFGDFNTETDTDVSFNFFSVQSILAFFMGFGWMGFGGLKQLNLHPLENFIAASVVGIIFMFVSALLMFLTKKLEKKVTKDKTTAIGTVGKAYTSFSPNASGQVEIEICGQLSVVQAINNKDEQINSFDSVKVVDVKGDILYIEKTK